MLKKRFMLIMSIIMLLSTCITVNAAIKTSVTVNLSLGIGEEEDLSKYLTDKSDIVWTNKNAGIAAVKDNKVKGSKEGNAKITASAKTYNYIFNVKVFKNDAFSTSEKDNKIISADTNVELKKTNSKKDNGKLSYKDKALTIGVNEKVDLNGLLNKEYKYFNYSWTTSCDGYVELDKGCIKGKKEGMVRINAKGSNSEKNTCYRFYVTIDSNYTAKNLSYGKNRNIDFTKELAEKPDKYIYTVVSSGPAKINEKEDYTISTGTSTGATIITAESITGGKNYTLIIKTI